MEENLYDTIEYRGFKIEIFYDTDYESPSSWEDNEVVLVNYHRDFEVERNDIITKDELIDIANGEKLDIQKKYHIFPVDMYSHSGVNIWIANDFSSPGGWDNSASGAVLVSKKSFRLKKRATEVAENLVKTWNQALSGEVCGYIIKDFPGEMDSCWGFYGDPKDEGGLIDNAKESIDYTIKKAIKKNEERLKKLIKNKVPIQYREPFTIK